MQLKYAVTYIVLIVMLLVFLNTYPVSTARKLVFTSKQSTMAAQVSVVAASLSELGALTEDEVGKVMSLLDDLNMTRVIITDPEARILYDTLDTESTIGRYAMFPEIYRALLGKDVFASELAGGAFMSSASMPICYRSTTIGAIYLYEYDTRQGEFMDNIRGNLLRVSFAVAAFSIILAYVFSRLLTRRFAEVLRAIKIVREGGYGYQVPVTGHDELAELTSEFNSLTERIKTTDEMRRRFVSDASHELKTPLAAIKLLSDSITQNEGMDSATAREFVADIGSEAERLNRITEKLLSLTRLEAGARPKPGPTDLKNAVKKSMQAISPMAGKSGVTLEGRLEDGCVVVATEDDLHQIAFNLIENAVKYNNPGGSVLIGLSRGDGLVRFTVEDTGVGIPEADMPHIFDRFYRVDKARSREAGGSGLGLSIVRDAVSINGGEVYAEKLRAGGMRFTVVFPRCGEEKEI